MNVHEKDGSDPHDVTQPTTLKYLKIVLLLMTVVTFQCIFGTHLNVSSVIRRSKKGTGARDLGHIDDRHRREQEPSVARETETSEAATIFFIHYHKTGNNFVVDLLKEIQRTYDQHNLSMKENSILNRMKNKGNKGHLQRAREKHDQRMIGREDMDDDDAFGDIPNESLITGRADDVNNTLLVLQRSHDAKTGCPVLGDEEFEMGAAYRLLAPNLFCILSMPVNEQVGFQDETAGVTPPSDTITSHRSAHDIRGKLPFPAWETTKIIHFVRDPIDMALSNYLYHSRYPTPEPWVKSRDTNPCKTDDLFLNLTLNKLNEVKYSRKISKQDLLEVIGMCRYYKEDHPISKSNPNNNKTDLFMESCVGCHSTMDSDSPLHIS